MDQNFRTTGSTIAIGFLSFSTILGFLTGIAFLSGYFDKNLLIGILLIFCGCISLAVTISIYISSKRENKISKKQLAEITKRQSSSPATSILANWIYSDSEWNQFLSWEKKKRRAGTMMEVTGIVIMGSFLIYMLPDGKWLAAIGYSCALGLVYGLIKFKLMMSSIKTDHHKMPEVIITPEAVLINGHMNRFYGENLWLGKVDIKETKEMNVLEITYCWNMKHGKTADEIRVPVPKGKLREAILVQEILSRELGSRD